MPFSEPPRTLPDVVVDITERTPDAGSRRAVLATLAVSSCLFLALVPFAKLQLAPAHWFIPLVQSALVINDLVTAVLLLGQLRLAGRTALLLLAGGYLYTALMASIHLLTFPGVFTTGGLLGAGAQTTGYLHVFWHLGLPCAVVGYVVARKRQRLLAMDPRRAVPLMVGAVGLVALAVTLLATLGNDLLPPMLKGYHYSSEFNIGRYGQWLATAAAILVLWRSRGRSVLDLWLVVMLCNSFFEIGLVSIFNAGRYDLGFYAGRVYALLSSCTVLVMLLAEHGKLLRELAAARRTARTEAALRERREATTRILESITDGFFAVDAEWRFTYVNREAERLLQRSRSELLGRSLWREFPAATGTAFRQQYERARAEGRTVAFEEYYAPLGIWVEVRAFPSAAGLSVYFHDVTARRQAQVELQESEERYRVLADMIPQHIWVTGPDGHHNYFSRSWYEFTGTTPGQSVGEGWMAWLHPDDRERTLSTWHHALATGEPYSIEYRFRGADGRYRWFIGQAAPLRNSAGAIVQWFGTLTDISERKQHEAERERLLANEREAREEAERRRAQLERVTESRARLMRGFSHDLRSPLAAAEMNAALLEAGRAWGLLNDRQVEGVRRIRRGLRTSVRLIDDLLELARAEAGQIELRPADVDVRELALEVADDFHAQGAAAGVDFAVDIPAGLRARADSMRMRQVLANLVSNAIKYAPHGRATLHARLADGDRVAVSVVDTGPGIPEEKLELVFEEYTRLTPGTQEGSGIGLAISRRMARLMGGDLTLESETGRGSVFTLWLPAAAPAPAPAPAARASAAWA